MVWASLREGFMFQDGLSRSVQKDGMSGYSGLRLSRVLLVCLAPLLLTQCRMTRETATQQPTRSSNLSIKSEILASQAALKPFSDEDLEDVVWVSANSYPGAPTEIHGFDLAEEIWCLPLKDETRCLKKPNPWRERCLSQGGTVKRCQDCREICDKPLARP